MIKAVIFDLDGTIITEDHIQEGLKYVYRRNSKFLKDISLSAFLSANEKAVQHIIELRKKGSILLHQTGIRIWYEVLSDLNIPLSAELVYSMYKDLQKFILENIKLDPEFIPLVEEIKAKGIKIGILSNGLFIERFERVAKVKIINYINVLVSSDMLGVEKPNIKIFKYICDLLEVDPKETVYVGNDSYQDIRGAQNTGMIPILLAKKGVEEQKTLGSVTIARSFGEIQKILNNLIP